MLVHPTHVFDGLIVNAEARNVSNTFLIYCICAFHVLLKMKISSKYETTQSTSPSVSIMAF